MPSNEDAHPEYSGLKKVRTGFHVAGYLTRTLGDKLTFGVVSKGIQRLSDAVRGYKRIPPHGTVSLNVGGQDVDLPSSFLGKKVPPGKTLESLTAEVQEKINSGERLLHDIKNDTAPQQCSQKNMTDLMMYLQARAQSQHGNFVEGSMSIPDPDNKIKIFLDTNPEAYQRKSSHIGEFQNQAGGEGTHRGIDAYGRTRNTDEMLPNGRKTLMYGTMHHDPQGMKMPENRLWMKMESHGAWAFSPKVNDPTGPKRSANSHDGKAAVGHSLSFLETLGKGSAKGSRKERIPDDIKAAWKQLQKLARKDLEGKNPPDELTQMLRDGEGLQTARGVRFINDYLNTLQGTQALSPELRDQAKYMQNVLKSRFPQDTLNARIGNEVILKDDDLRPREKSKIHGPVLNQRRGATVEGLGERGAEVAVRAGLRH
jgi:hypothetical protein